MKRKKSKKRKTIKKGQNLVQSEAVPVSAVLVPAGESAGTGNGQAAAADSTDGTSGEGEKETKKRGTTFARQLYFFDVVLTNSLSDPLIRQYVLEYGYTGERLNDGKQKADDARKKYETQQKALAAQAECSRILTEKWSEADKVYREFVRVIRLGFENQETIIRTLGISKRKKGFGDWVANTEIFYNNVFALPGVLEFMGKLDITREKVEEGQRLFNETKKAKMDLKNAIGEAQKATEQKAIAFGKIRKWWRNYKKIIDIALEKDPQLKEKLGLTTPLQEQEQQ